MTRPSFVILVLTGDRTTDNTMHTFSLMMYADMGRLELWLC